MTITELEASEASEAVSLLKEVIEDFNNDDEGRLSVETASAIRALLAKLDGEVK